MLCVQDMLGGGVCVNSRWGAPGAMAQKPGWVKQMSSGLSLGLKKHCIESPLEPLPLPPASISEEVGGTPKLENLQGDFLAQEATFENLSTLCCFPPRTLQGWAARWLQEEPQLMQRLSNSCSMEQWEPARGPSLQRS